MNKFIVIFMTAALYFWTAPPTIAEEFILEYNTAFTLRDRDPLDGEADAIDDIPPSGFWGFITNSDSQIDEFLLEFDISNLEAACSAKFNFFFSMWGPTSLPYELNIAVYEADGIANLGDFGAGDFFASAIISNIEENVFLVDLTSVFNSFINSGISHLGIRLYDPVSIVSPIGDAQLRFEEGNLIIIPTPAFGDMMHPTGAVHAHDNLLWPPNNKTVPVKIEGYVVDELSAVRDGDGIGVSQAYLLVNSKKIILRDETTGFNLLNPDGSYSIVEYLEARKNAIYPIELFAADTAEGENGNPNFGLVDSTSVRVLNNMGDKPKGKEEKKKKNKKKSKTKKYW